MAPVVIGSIGVGLLLAAFVLNLGRWLAERSPAYLIMNAVGALLSAWYAARLGSTPFVILESIWTGAALVRLGMVMKKGLR
jgi:hypothetical protein